MRALVSLDVCSISVIQRISKRFERPSPPHEVRLFLFVCSFCPFGRSKIADGTHISGTIAGNWEKFSTSNKRTSARPHWSRYRLCAKLRKRGQAESMDEMMLPSRAWLLLVKECEWEGSGETLFSPCTFYSRGRVSEMERKRD